MLKQFYQQAVSPKIATQIILSGAPMTINRWMTKAAEIDLAFRRTNTLFAKGIQGGHNGMSARKHPWKPKLGGSQWNHDQGEPMDIDAIQQGSSADERKKTVECYNCRKRGHYAADCRSPRRGEQHGHDQCSRGRNSRARRRSSPQAGCGSTSAR
jgi:hypothetical protein